MQLTWTGQSQHMASVAPQPPALLAGALADSLLLVRQNSVTGQDEVSRTRLGEAGSVGLEYSHQAALASCPGCTTGVGWAGLATATLL